MNDDGKRLRSEKGFYFTPEAVDRMAAWSETMRRKDLVAVLDVNIMPPLNDIRPGLVGQRKEKLLPQVTVEDSVRGVHFYWAAREHALDELRDYCIHMEAKRPTSIIPLKPGAPDKVKQALKDLQSKAELGNAQAQLDLGGLYTRGDLEYYLPHLGLKQSYAEAMKWYQLAAAQGHAEAQFRLGLVFSKGLGVEPNYTEAMKWYQLAAAQGLAKAQKNINLLKEYGIVRQLTAEGQIEKVLLLAERDAVVLIVKDGFTGEIHRNGTVESDRGAATYYARPDYMTYVEGGREKATVTVVIPDGAKEFFGPGMRVKFYSFGGAAPAPVSKP